MSSQLTQESDSFDFDHMVAEAVQYFLIMEQKKYPVKKNDITKLVKLKGSSTKTFKAIIDKASQYLEEIFGFKVHEVEEKAGHYIMTNTIVQQNCFPNQKGSDDTSILFIILTAIYLSGGQITEDEIWNMLDTLGYHAEEYRKLVLQELVKQLYISTEVIPLSEPPKQNLFWGERAKIELTKLQILDFASKIYGIPPDSFGALYSDALKDNQGTSTQN